MNKAVAKHKPQEVAQSAAVTPMELLQSAIQTGVSTDQLERLMGMQERWAANQARAAFDVAISAAKAEIPVISKNRTVSYSGTSYKHEDLAEIARTVDPVLARHGLSYRFRTETKDGAVTVTCIVSHRDGHNEENSLAAGADKSGSKNAIQSIGSTITYLQRYTLKAALGLAAAEDDDAASAEPTETITDEQVKELRELAEESGADIIKLCKYLKVAALADIPASGFENVKAKILQKKRASK